MGAVAKTLEKTVGFVQVVVVVVVVVVVWVNVDWSRSGPGERASDLNSVTEGI